MNAEVADSAAVQAGRPRAVIAESGPGAALGTVGGPEPLITVLTGVHHPRPDRPLLPPAEARR